MEVSSTPTPSFDMTDRLSFRSDQSIINPHGKYGRGLEAKMPESGSFYEPDSEVSSEYKTGILIQKPSKRKPTFSASNATTALAPSIIAAEKTGPSQEPPRAEAMFKNKTVSQSLRSDDTRGEAIDTQPQSESDTSGAVSKGSRRGRLKDWINRVIDS